MTGASKDWLRMMIALVKDLSRTSLHCTCQKLKKDKATCIDKVVDPQCISKGAGLSIIPRG